MVIYGGEGIRSNSVPTSSSVHRADASSAPFLPTASLSQPSHLSGTTSKIEQSHSSTHPYTQSVGKLKGVCPGDTLTSSKSFGNHEKEEKQKIKTGTQAWSAANIKTQPQSSSIYELPPPSSGHHHNPAVKVGGSALSSPPMITCLDDMFVFDTTSQIWFPIQCSLAPLPRKGHSLNSCYFSSPKGGVAATVSSNNDKKNVLIMFGGYSIENNTLSNSIFICEIDKVIDYYESSKKHYVEKLQQEKEEQERPLSSSSSAAAIANQNQQHRGSKSHLKGPKLGLRETDIPPLIWRTMTTQGNPPSPRYRHSATIAYGSSSEPLLVITGGIGKDPKIALNDIYILDIENQLWITLKNGNDSLTKGLSSGDGPSAGIYGHVSFPVLKASSSSSYSDSNNNHHTEESRATNGYEILVFGGSSNTSSGKSSCYSSLFAFDLTTHLWRKCDVGHTFPSSRYGHSVCLLEGCSAINNIPSSSSGAVVPSQQQQQVSPHTPSAHQLTHYPSHSNQAKQASCAIIFGGTGPVSSFSDSWILDLRWKESNFSQFTNGIDNLIQNNMENYFNEALLSQQQQQEQQQQHQQYLAATNPQQQQLVQQQQQQPQYQQQQQFHHQQQYLLHQNAVKASMSFPNITSSYTIGMPSYSPAASAPQLPGGLNNTFAGAATSQKIYSSNNKKYLNTMTTTGNSSPASSSFIDSRYPSSLPSAHQQQVQFQQPPQQRQFRMKGSLSTPALVEARGINEGDDRRPSFAEGIPLVDDINISEDYNEQQERRRPSNLGDSYRQQQQDNHVSDDAAVNELILKVFTS
jgi:hypothetical protein